MRLSIIVGTRDRPSHLNHFLSCLDVQTRKDFQVIVCDESDENVHDNRELVEWWWANRGLQIRLQRSSWEQDWHYTAKAAAAALLAEGDFLAFPNDDAYYVPTFVEEMTGHAEGVVICDWVWDRANYSKRDGFPKVGQVDVGGFVVDRQDFLEVGWGEPIHLADGKMVEAVVESGAGWRHVPKVLYVKN